MTPALAFKMILPAAFFGYAAVANLMLWQDAEDWPLRDGVLTGGLTAEIDTLYREALPHKDPAIGIIGAARYALLDEGRAGVVVGRDGVLFTAEETRPFDAALYAAALARIEGAARALDDAGTALVVVPVPAKIDVMSDHGPGAASAQAAWELYARFQNDLAARAIPTVQARAALMATAQPFVTTDTHWTVTGASAVAQALAATGTIAPGNAGYAPQRAAPVQRTGDLVRFVTTDRLAPMVGLGPVTIAPLTATAPPAAAGTVALDIFGGGGGGGGGVDLVGTSYSANADWSFVPALQLALDRDVINHAQEGRGPFAPMEDYLRALDPLAAPEAVIWEIPVRYLTDPALLAEGRA